MMLRVCGAALLVSLLAALLSELGFRQKRLFTLLSLVVILSLFADGISRAVSVVTSLGEYASIGDASRCALKAVGAGYLFGFTSDACDELGERGVASLVNIGARVEIFLISLPYLEEVIKLGVELLK